MVDSSNCFKQTSLFVIYFGSCSWASRSARSHTDQAAPRAGITTLLTLVMVNEGKHCPRTHMIPALGPQLNPVFMGVDPQTRW